MTAGLNQLAPGLCVHRYTAKPLRFPIDLNPRHRMHARRIDGLEWDLCAFVRSRTIISLNCCAEIRMKMGNRAERDIALDEMETGINLAKCQQCGCMRETLDQLGKSIAILPTDRSFEFRDGIARWESKMKSIRYSCLGCEHCYAGSAQNAFTAAFPETAGDFGLSCEIQAKPVGWPPVVGEYFILNPSAPVAVTTLASLDFPKQLVDQKIPGLAIVGKLETENIGIDKLIKNTIANPRLQYLILAGSEPAGHNSGQTLLALSENGVDDDKHVIGSNGKRPILRNVSRLEIDAFRSQIQVIDLIGCECIDCVRDRIAELNNQIVEIELQPASCGCSDGGCSAPALDIDKVPAVFVEEKDNPVKLDKAGYFVILPIQERKVIHIEHYTYDNSLQHVLEGNSARSLYLKIIEEKWVSEMSHAAYLGKELAKAELNLTHGILYTQDAA
jgi:tetrahydromethanopterin S-methyltransferase subunit A